MFTVKTLEVKNSLKMVLLVEEQVPCGVYTYKKYVIKTLYCKRNKRGRIYIHIIK